MHQKITYTYYCVNNLPLVLSEGEVITVIQRAHAHTNDCQTIIKNTNNNHAHKHAQGPSHDTKLNWYSYF